MSLIESGIDGEEAIIALCLGQLRSQFGRKAVRQPKNNMLNKVGAIDMRKIAARPPTGMRFN
jgi:hypothetical protein